MGVTICGENFKYTTTEFQDGNIEGATTEVEDGNLHLFVGLVDTVCQSCSGRLVDDTTDFQACDFSGFLCSLTLCVREISRNSDDCIRHFLTQIVFCRLLHLLKDHCRNLLRCIFAPLDFYTRIAILIHYGIRYTGNLLSTLVIGLTHETLDRINGVLRIRDSLAFGRVTDLTLAVFDKTYYGRCRPFTFAVSNNYRLIAFEYGNATVSCS